MNRRAKLDSVATVENARAWLRDSNPYLFAEYLIADSGAYDDSPNGSVPDSAVRWLESRFDSLLIFEEPLDP